MIAARAMPWRGPLSNNATFSNHHICAREHAPFSPARRPARRPQSAHAGMHLCWFACSALGPPRRQYDPRLCGLGDGPPLVCHRHAQTCTSGPRGSGGRKAAIVGEEEVRGGDGACMSQRRHLGRRRRRRAPPQSGHSAVGGRRGVSWPPSSTRTSNSLLPFCMFFGTEIATASLNCPRAWGRRGPRWLPAGAPEILLGVWCVAQSERAALPSSLPPRTYTRAPVRACVHLCVLLCVRACSCAPVCACVHLCVRAPLRASFCA